RRPHRRRAPHRATRAVSSGRTRSRGRRLDGLRIQAAWPSAWQSTALNAGSARLAVWGAPSADVTGCPAVGWAPRYCDGSSDRLDAVSLGTLGALAGGVLHPLVVLEAAVTVSLNHGVVNEHVARSVVGGDETITLVGVEPLHCTLSHFCAFSYWNDLRDPHAWILDYGDRLCSKAGLWKSAAPAVRTSQAL